MGTAKFKTNMVAFSTQDSAIAQLTLPWSHPCPLEVGKSHVLYQFIWGLWIFAGGLMAIYGERIANSSSFSTSKIALEVPVIQHLCTQRRHIDHEIVVLI